jgi:hypothetical protein
MSDDRIQTKLLRHERDNCSREYGVGDSEEIVGLDDFCPLNPWDGHSPLVVAVGDWACQHCNLNWQWAKVVFHVDQVGSRLVGTIRELIGFRPSRAEELAEFHYLVSDLAELSGLWEPPPRFNWPEGFARWLACPVPERSERVAAGFRSWCHEVAGVSI